jgi:subtilisin
VIQARLHQPGWVRDDLRSATGKGIRIGVIDSGWDRSLGDLHVKRGIGLVDPADELELLSSDDYHDRIGHGTACTDLILRIATDADVVPIRVFGRHLETSPHVLHAALLWAVEHELRIVNMSLGTLIPEARDTLYAACEIARRNGVIIVAAGHILGKQSFPAVFENVIGVGAARFTDPFQYSFNAGGAFECVARGYGQVSRSLGGQATVGNGTSFAAPNITGIVALFIERYPDVDLAGVRSLLAQHAVTNC